MTRARLIRSGLVLCVLGIAGIVWSGRPGTADDLKLVAAGAAIAWGTALWALAVDRP